jgi:hypothetical protein
MAQNEEPRREPRRYDEKDEKEEEKEAGKHEEKDESWEEKWQRDPVSAAAWAAILIWAGIAFLIGNLGMLTRYEGVDAWDLVLLGAGAILLLEVAVRLSVPEYRQPIAGTLIFGFVLLVIGLGNIVNISVFWPLVLIAIGAFAIIRGLTSQD